MAAAIGYDAGMTPVPKSTPLAKLHPASWNPRKIDPVAFESLKRSLVADPDFLLLRPVLATKAGTIYAGNQRYRAAEALGWSTIPAIIVDIPEDLAKARALRDNNMTGEYVDEALAAMLAELQDTIDLGDLGFSAADLDRIMGPAVEEVAFPGLPEGDQGPIRTMTFTLTVEQELTVVEALDRAKRLGNFPTDGNSNGLALERIAEAYDQ